MTRRVVAAALFLSVLGACTRGHESQRGIADRRPVIAEERSTCELLERVDLGLVSHSTGDIGRSADVLARAATTAPTELRPALASAALAYRAAAAGAVPADELRRAAALRALHLWIADHCGHSMGHARPGSDPAGSGPRPVDENAGVPTP